MTHCFDTNTKSICRQTREENGKIEEQQKEKMKEKQRKETHKRRTRRKKRNKQNIKKKYVFLFIQDEAEKEKIMQKKENR